MANTAGAAAGSMGELRNVVLLCRLNLCGMLRDRILHAIIGAVVVILLLVPLVSSFSMRQVQELAISLSLSGISFFLLTVALMFGSSAIWGDIERRYTTTVLTLPLSRGAYVVAKFLAIALFLVAAGVVLGLAALLVIYLAAATYPSDQPIVLGNVLLALGGDVGKSVLIAALAILLSSLSTSLYLPFFGTTILYLCGSASQEVIEYISGEYGRTLHPLVVTSVRSVYYLLPNLSAFDLKVQAVYALPIPAEQVFFVATYWLVYTGIIVVLSVEVFKRRVLS